MRKKFVYIIIISTLIISGGIVSGILIFLYFNVPNSYFVIEIYDPDKAYNGTTLLTDLSDEDNPRIVEVDMKGNILWQYNLPESLKNYTNPGLDAELLPNDHILFVAPLKGVYEIDRSGSIVWSYLDDKVSHDADRLPNGNTLINWGGMDNENDTQIKEVNSTGSIVWHWEAKPYFYSNPKYQNISMQGWTHANAVHRLSNGNTMVNLRNFNLTVIVNSTGDITWQHDWSAIGDDPHEPEILPGGNVLIALQWTAPDHAVEIDMSNHNVTWSYSRNNVTFARDADRLPNGNTLIQAVVNRSPKIYEVTPVGEIVWQLAVRGKILSQLSPGWFYKAQRI